MSNRHRKPSKTDNTDESRFASGRSIRSLTLLGALVLTNLYWWRRERTVRESLSVSRKRERDVTAEDHHEVVSAAQKSADLLDARPAVLPERIETLDEERRELRRELERTRQKWADAWWFTRVEHTPSTADVRVAAIHLPRGRLEDVEALAKRATEDDHGIGIGFAGGDGTFAVGVGTSAADDLPADEIADRIVTTAGEGGGGGSDHYASGAAPFDDIDRGVETLLDDLTDGRVETDWIDITAVGDG